MNKQVQHFRCLSVPSTKYQDDKNDYREEKDGGLKISSVFCVCANIKIVKTERGLK